MAIAKPITTSIHQESVTCGDLSKALPISGAVLSKPTPEAAIEAEDPVLPLYRQWTEARANWRRLAALPGNGNFDTPESKVEEEAEHTAFLALIELTPTSPAGIAALAHVLWDLEGPVVPQDHDEFAALADKPSCKLIHAIWRASSGENGFPNVDVTPTS